MKDVTVTIWVKQEDFAYFCEVLKTISNLPENYFDYHFRAEDIKYSTQLHSHWIQVNLPLPLYLKWEICYRTNS